MAEQSFRVMCGLRYPSSRAGRSPGHRAQVPKCFTRWGFRTRGAVGVQAVAASA